MKTAKPIPVKEIDDHFYEVSAPFNSRTTLEKPSHFPSPFERAIGNEYYFATHIEGKIFGGRAAQGKENNKLRITIYSADEEIDESKRNQVREELARRFGLLLDISGFENVWNSDAILSKLPHEMLGARPSSPFALYEFLVVCTLLQNTTVRRTVQMAEALADTIGTTVKFPNELVLCGFWKPGDLVDFGEPALRDLKLGYRAKILDRVSRHFLDQPGTENRLMEYVNEPDCLRSELKKIYGVGPASAGYIMFEWFKCVNEFSHVSPWERKILGNLLYDGREVSMAELTEYCHTKWNPFTMLAVHSVFESVFWQRKSGQGPGWLNELIRL